jgi:hypothetical protein
MLRAGPGVREGLLIWGGVLAHSAGARWENLPSNKPDSGPAGAPE